MNNEKQVSDIVHRSGSNQSVKVAGHLLCFHCATNNIHCGIVLIGIYIEITQIYSFI